VVIPFLLRERFCLDNIIFTPFKGGMATFYK